MKNLLAQEGTPLGKPLEGIGTLGTPGEGFPLFTKFISSTIGLLTIVAIIWFVFVLITGAIGMIGAGGDKAALESSRKRITSGIIGLVIVIAAVFIVDLIGRILGIENILNIPELVKSLPIVGD
ncbi:MAG: hypothetical protein AAB875_06400 [Patescibacteria group bacterium]